MPNQYTVRTGRTLAAQDTTEVSTTLQIATQKGVDVNFTSSELTLSLDDFSERILKPAMSVLAANIESDALTMYKDVYQQVNNHGASATLSKTLSARKALVDSLAGTDLNLCLDTQSNVDLVDALKGLFHDSKEVAKQYRDGMIGRTAGFDIWENTLMPAHTRGAANGSYVINTSTGLTSGSATLAVTAGTGAMVVGDVFTIADVFRVHPETKVSTGNLQQFVVTAAYAGGAGNITVSPTPVTSGATQNVTLVSAGAGKAITFAGTASTASQTSLAFHKDAFAFATADLVMPKGVDFASRQVLDGISMRIVRAYDISSDAMNTRIDVLYGFKTIRPQLAARIANN